MTNHVLLDNVTHQHLRVITTPSAAFGDDLQVVPTFPTEYADMQREYPIFFRRDSRGDLQSVALLGLEEGENLFLDGERWRGRYLPGIIARGPFLIGFQEREADGAVRREPVMHIDMDSPRISESDGEPLFLEHGGNSPYLAQVAGILRGIHEGLAAGKAMLDAFDACGLIEPVELKVDVLRDVQYLLKGYLTINRDRLKELDGATLERLNGAGFLEGAFLVLASQGNLNRLIEMKRERGAKPAAQAARG